MDDEIIQIKKEAWSSIHDQYTEITHSFDTWYNDFSEQQNEEEVELVETVAGVQLVPIEEEKEDTYFVPEHIWELEDKLKKIKTSILQRDSSQLAPLFDDVERCCSYLGVEFTLDHEVLDDALSISNIIVRQPIFTPPKLTFLTSNLIIPVHSNLISLIRERPESIFMITPREFEEIIAELFRARGFNVELTQATRDGGRDIIAINETMNVRSKYLIECKRYSLDRKVTLSIVQRLYGVQQSEAANKAILATSSTFTKDALNFASHHVWDLDLKSYDDIMSWIREYNFLTRK